ncbi:nucleotide-binding domain-containing protein [Leptospira interrogans]
MIKDSGNYEKVEQTLFKGDHVVECYAIKNGILVAKDRIHVPISLNG